MTTSSEAACRSEQLGALFCGDEERDTPDEAESLPLLSSRVPSDDASDEEVVCRPTPEAFDEPPEPPSEPRPSEAEGSDRSETACVRSDDARPTEVDRLVWASESKAISPPSASDIIAWSVDGVGFGCGGASSVLGASAPPAPPAAPTLSPPSAPPVVSIVGDLELVPPWTSPTVPHVGPVAAAISTWLFVANHSASLVRTKSSTEISPSWCISSSRFEVEEKPEMEPRVFSRGMAESIGDAPGIG